MQESELFDLIKSKIKVELLDLNKNYLGQARYSIEHTNPGFSMPTGAMIAGVNDACIQGIHDRAKRIVSIIREIVSDMDYPTSNQLAKGLKKIVENFLPEDLNDFRLHQNFEAPEQAKQAYDDLLQKARDESLNRSYIEIDLFIQKRIRDNLISNKVDISNDLFMLLSDMVEAHRKLPKEKRMPFLIHKESTSHSDYMIHNGLPKNFSCHFSDIVELESLGLVSIKGIARTPQVSITQIGYKYYDEIKAESSDYVDPPNIQTKYDVVARALNDARELIKTSGPTSVVDRIHTVLHGYLIEKCKESNIATEPDDPLTSIFKKLRTQHPSLINDPLFKDQIIKITNSFSSIIDTLNNFRNNFSTSHPNENLLPEPEAMLMINSVRTILTYFESKLISK